VLLVGLLATSSAAADPVTKEQCISTNEEGQDLRRAGRLRAAADRFTYCSAAVCPTVLRQDCIARLEDVQRAMPTVVFDARDPRGNHVTAVTVTIDDAPFAERLDGTALPVEPGTHRFVFKTAGARPLSKELSIREGDKDRHERIALAVSEANDDEVRPVVPAPAPATTPTTATYVAFGVAGLGAITGGVFTVLALNEKAKCPDDAGQMHCPPPIDDHENDAAVKRDSLIAGIGYGAAVVGAAVGIWLLVTSPSAKADKRADASGRHVAPLLGDRWAGIGGNF
jgi:hypothetical protein